MPIENEPMNRCTAGSGETINYFAQCGVNVSVSTLPESWHSATVTTVHHCRRCGRGRCSRGCVRARVLLLIPLWLVLLWLCSFEGYRQIPGNGLAHD